MGVQYTICHWAINRTDSQNSLSTTLDVSLQHVPLRVQDPERVQFAYWSLPYWFCPNAKVTGADILSDVPRHLQPPVVPRDQFQCFLVSGVPSNLHIMTQGDHSSL